MESECSQKATIVGKTIEIIVGVALALLLLLAVDSLLSLAILVGNVSHSIQSTVDIPWFGTLVFLVLNIGTGVIGVAMLWFIKQTTRRRWKYFGISFFTISTIIYSGALLYGIFLGWLALGGFVFT